jgi:hypothetical protein
MKKMILWQLTAMLVFCIAMASPVFAGGFKSSYDKDSEQYYRDKERYYMDREHDDLEEYADELRNKERRLREQCPSPVVEGVPMPVPAPRVVIVPRKYYYLDEDSGEYFGVYGNFDSDWSPPLAWGWSPWTPGIGIYGWIGCGWDRDRGRIVINNFDIRNGGFDRDRFSRRFNERFGRSELSHNHNRENLSDQFRGRSDRREMNRGGQFSGHRNFQPQKSILQTRGYNMNNSRGNWSSEPRNLQPQVRTPIAAPRHMPQAQPRARENQQPRRR